MRRIGSMARYVWAFPATLVGVMFSVIALGAGATVHFVGGTMEVSGGSVSRLIGLMPVRLRFTAITLGHVIVGIDHEALGRARFHEQVHVQQYERWGVLFFALYILSSVVQLVRGRHPYFDNCFEREAHERDAARLRSRTSRASRTDAPGTIALQ